MAAHDQHGANARPPAEVTKARPGQGYAPVWKDWQP